MSALDKIGLISISTTLIPLMTCFVIIKRLKYQFLPILLLLSVSFITDIISASLKTKGINNFIVFRLYTIVEFMILVMFYRLNNKKEFAPAIIIISLLSFIVAATIDLSRNGIINMDDVSSSTSSLILLSYSLYSFYIIIKKQTYDNVLDMPFFWVNSAILLYFSGNLLLFLLVIMF